MTDHQKFKSILKEQDLNYHDLANILEMKYDSVKNMLAPGKKQLPKWAKTMMYAYENKK